MIFTLGLIALVIGLICYHTGRDGTTDAHDKAEAFGGMMTVCGGLAMFVSLCILTWRYLP